MTAQRFTVETREQAAVVLGATTELTQALVMSLKSKGVYAQQLESIFDLEAMSKTHDPDYVILLSDTLTPTWLAGEGRELIAALLPLIQSGASRLFTLTHAQYNHPPQDLAPVTKHLLYPDYVGERELCSPQLQSWLDDINRGKPLIIPEDGLQEVSILGVRELAGQIVAAILEPSKRMGESRAILGASASLLNLAYLVRTSLLFKIQLVFENVKQEDYRLQRPSTRPSPDKVSHHPDDFPQDLLKKYFKTHAKPPTPPTVPVPPPSATETNPKLAPLKSRAPVFVPLSTPKPKPRLLWPKRPAPKSSPPRLLWIIGRGMVIAFALYLGSLACFATITGLTLRYILREFSNNEVPHVTGLNSFALTYVRANWALIGSLPGIKPQRPVSEISLLLDAYEQALRALSTTQTLENSTKELAHYVFGSGEADPVQLLSQSRLATEELYSQLSLLEGLLPTQTPHVLATRYDLDYQAGRAKLADLKRSVVTAKALLASAPDVIALGGRRKYVVLFQNNMELRSTGGFIGSFALLSFENGKLYDMPIFDVYEADGQLKGHVEPPPPIRDILGEANWYLRDSNFDPDFPTSARRAEWFIQKSLGQTLDGTIAVNVSSLKAILKATGPLEIPDYEETISESNLYERAQFHAEVNFFPGSTQKKEFLSTVASALFARLPHVSSGEGIKLMMALAQSIEAKDTLISLINPVSAHAFEVLGWDGALVDLPCPALDHCHKDYAMVVDNNFGVNKANYFVTRNIEQVITFDKDLLVNHTLRLRYNNTSTSSAWPAGAYKNYQRLYLPQGTNVSEIKVDGRILTNPEITLSSQQNYVVLSHLMTVPVSSSVLVEVTYTTPQIAESGEFVYSWYWQKQPGTFATDPLTVYLNHPLYLKPEIVSPLAELTTQQLKFNMANDKDRRLTVKFSQ